MGTCRRTCEKITEDEKKDGLNQKGRNMTLRPASVKPTCGLTSRMQIFPVSTTSWMELILVP